jgi:chaperonin cofactor prefoldin
MKSYQEQYKDNLKLKKDIIKEIEGLTKDADKNLDKFNELREKFAELGYVPKKNIASIKEDFQTVVTNFLNELTVLNIKEKTEISLETEFNDLAGGEHSENELYHKEQSVRRQISKLEDDIALWQNNLEFFAHSKSTDKLRKEVNEKISTAQEKVDGLRRQLKMLRSL